MSFTHEFQSFAKDSIETYGASVTLRKPAIQSYDTATGQVTSTVNDSPIKGIIEDFSEHFIARGLVKAGDRKVTIAATALLVTPEQGDKLLIGGAAYDIVHVKADYAGDSAVVYELHVRA